MRERGSLSEQQRDDAVALFEAGYGPKRVATLLGGGRRAVSRVYDRWRVRGREALVPAPTKRTVAFEVKCELVRRYLAGESKLALTREYALSSPKVLESWVRIYRAEGEDGLRPKPKGRPKRAPAAPVREESELERLRRENERLRAENAYLEKLRALSAAERR
jgi:transposase-like protein